MFQAYDPLIERSGERDVIHFIPDENGEWLWKADVVARIKEVMETFEKLNQVTDRLNEDNRRLIEFYRNELQKMTNERNEARQELAKLQESNKSES